MEVHRFSTEIEELIEFLTSHSWPYHQETNPNAQTIKMRFEQGYFTKNNETFWVTKNKKKIGLLIIFDIEDSIVLFDLRLLPTEQGKGYGVELLRWLQNYLFNQPTISRVEGYTRSDNISMRKCFLKAGFVKEGYLRGAWENADGSMSDTIIFGAIKKDWENKCITPVNMGESLY